MYHYLLWGDIQDILEKSKDEKIRLEYIEPCLQDILQGNNEICRDRYRMMVEKLKQVFSIN